jgi:LmbE family N-acetylglucosaminyl deacetylase
MKLLEASGLRRLLVVAPHADDEVLGAGGLIARATRAGWDAHVAYVTIAGYPSQARGDRSTSAERETEVRAALDTLGVASHGALFRDDAHHLRLDMVPQHDLVGFVENEVQRFQPDVVAVPCGSHAHQDHRAVASACAAALRPVQRDNPAFVTVVLAYGHMTLGPLGEQHPFQPNVLVDITESLDCKLAALDKYRSQTCPFPHPRSAEALRAQAHAWGSAAGVIAAEPYECVRWAL